MGLVSLNVIGYIALRYVTGPVQTPFEVLRQYIRLHQASSLESAQELISQDCLHSFNNKICE